MLRALHNKDLKSVGIESDSQSDKSGDSEDKTVENNVKKRRAIMITVKKAKEKK